MARRDKQDIRRGSGVIFLLFFLVRILAADIRADDAFSTAAPEDSDFILQDIENHIRAIQRKYHLEIIYRVLPPIDDPKLHFTLAVPTDDPFLLKYLELLEEEWAKYPSSFLAQSPLRQVYIVKRLFLEEQAVEGFAEKTRRVIILDFLRSRSNALRQRHNFHHEIFHSVFGRIGQDTDWEELNAEGFQYGKQKETESDNFDQPRLGFVTNYAMTAIEEDKAEVFGCLMMPSQHKLIRRWMEKDMVLKRKVEYMLRRLHDFCNEMDEDYWKGLMESKPL